MKPFPTACAEQNGLRQRLHTPAIQVSARQPMPLSLAPIQTGHAVYNQCAIDFSTMRWPQSKRVPHHLRA